MTQIVVINPHSPHINLLYLHLPTYIYSALCLIDLCQFLYINALTSTFVIRLSETYNANISYYLDQLSFYLTVKIKQKHIFLSYLKTVKSCIYFDLLRQSGTTQNVIRMYIGSSWYTPLGHRDETVRSNPRTVELVTALGRHRKYDSRRKHNLVR